MNTGVPAGTPPVRGPFGRLFTRARAWAADPRAERYLALMTFAESSFFPIPPESMLIPMTLARPHKALRYALIATVASVVGALYGYAIGYYASEWVKAAISLVGYASALDTVLLWFDRWGFLSVLVAGFTPIPYKLFTLGAGILGQALLPFMLASLIGRSTRFVLVCLLVSKTGPRMVPAIERHVERIGWTIVVLFTFTALWIGFGN